MLTGPVAEVVKGATGLDDRGIAKLHPGVEKLFRNIPKTLKYQTVAEVIKSEHCFARVKVGDKLVFDPFLGSGNGNKVLMKSNGRRPVRTWRDIHREPMTISEGIIEDRGPDGKRKKTCQKNKSYEK